MPVSWRSAEDYSSWVILTRREEWHELIIFNLTWAVFIDLINELFNVDGHLELVLDDVNEALSIDETPAICVTSQWDKCI